MKIPFDSLITDREPFILLERCKIEVSGGHVISRDSEGNFNIPIASIHCLMLGNGVSITSDAAALCAKHNCYIALVKGGLNAHSLWHCGRYSNPKNLVSQIEKHSDPVKRLEIAKKLMMLRISYIEKPYNTLIDRNSINNCKNVQELIGLEGSFARKTYAMLSNENGITFQRDQLSREGINQSLTLANNTLYNFIATICCSIGLSPSAGFIHGQSRRGGLVFDLADIFKHPLYFKEIFSGDFNKKPRDLMRFVSRKLSERNKYWTKEIIKAANIIC